MGIAESIKNMANKAADKVGADRTKGDSDAAGDDVDETDVGTYPDHLDRGLDVGRGQLDKRRREPPAT
ncbi:hypothetical protein [Micromonospora sp. NPDC049679]|uniref:hypothetical protein n=1 Tax=Micromonospora sp. NPDC049679 TaxID=3155920 RepID=UPI00340860C1